jgi:hypothetical protein
MNSINFKNKIGGALLGIALLFTIGMMSSTTAQAQWPYGQDRDRDYRRDRDRDRDRDYRRDRDRDDRYRRGGYGNVYRAAQDRGYQDGLSTGANDARDGKNYNPQRSHYYRNATDGYDRYYGNKDAYRQAYRDGFMRGYQEGYQRYGGGRNRNRNYRNGRWFPF